MSESRNDIRSKLAESTDIDEALIERLVREFYSKARIDPLLGPVFKSRIDVWEPHLKTIADFWESVALKRGAYHGQPMSKHVDLDIDATHFDRWLALWEETARDLCPEAAADRFVGLARRVGESLELGMAGKRGILPVKGERLPPLATSVDVSSSIGMGSRIDRSRTSAET
jgi:hemoglobin